MNSIIDKYRIIARYKYATNLAQYNEIEDLLLKEIKKNFFNSFFLASEARSSDTKYTDTNTKYTNTNTDTILILISDTDTKL